MEVPADSGGLSILNPSPMIIKGPNLLHTLVAKSSKDNLPAIDYYCSTGVGSSISYHELHSSAAALAARMLEILQPLRLANTQEQLVIPILIPQSPALYIGLLAILKIGAAFCPLNADTPRDRLGFILNDVKAKLVMVDSKLATRIPHDDACVVLSIDQSLDFLTTDAGQLVPYRVPKPNDLAYIMYTSGSTGTPKGVGISHHAATQCLLAHDRHIPPFVRFLQFAAPTFDVSVFEIFFPLFRGSTLVCSSRADMLSDLPGVLRGSRVDACELTPSVAGSLLKKRSNAPELCLVLTIGEMLTEPVIQEFGGDDYENSLLWGMYGPTEATIHCTVQPSFSKKSSKNNIGIPLDTVSAFVIDSETKEFRVLPLGQVGELAIGGSQVAAEYVNRPDQTSAAFLDTSWGRVYRTGDKARILADGTIECLGRIGGGQVKLNGQRIELGEIEHALLRTPGCHSALAVIISNVLVAFAAVEDCTESAGMRASILSQCRSWLPPFMIPTDLNIMEHFPRLPSGKIDKNTLIEQYEISMSRGPVGEEVFEDSLERQLCETAAAILEQRVAPSTYLPSLGMDSLAAIEYASRMRATGVVMNPIDIIEAATVRELIRVVKSRHDEMPPQGSTGPSLGQHPTDRFLNILSPDEAVQLRLDYVERVEPCSPLQEAMVAETLKDERLYINQTELRCPNHIAVDSIRSWFISLARQNENLRTGFSYIDNKIYQVVWKQLEDSQIKILDCPHPFEYVDVEHFLQHPLKIDIIPNRAPAGHHAIILTLHHSIYDGWSMDLLIEDLSRLARGELPIDRPQFSTLCQYLAAPLENDIDAKEFWAKKLRGCASATLPNFRTTAVQEPQILTACKEIKVDSGLIRDFAARASVGPQVVFQACLTWLWGAINGTDDNMTGFVSSGRTLPIAGVEKIMGPCMTTLPLRIILSEHTSVIELLQGIHMFNRETLRYSGLPLSEVKRAAGIAPSQKLFDVIFAYQETITSRKRTDGIIHEAWHKDAVEAKLLVEITPSHSNFSCQFTWHSDTFSHPQIDVLSSHLNSLVCCFIEDGDRPLSSILRYFPVSDLSRHNEIPNVLEVPSSLSKLVEEVVFSHPNHDALCFASSIDTSGVQAHTLTYQQLNSRANRIADFLRDSGVVPGGIVALVMEKSPLLYCAVLGILKSRCAYLPVLPSTPPQRIQLIFEQAQPQICLVDESPPRQVVEAIHCPVVNLSRVSLSKYRDFNIEISGDRSDLAYVIYTSGTTGRPKGVSVTNANILSNIEALSRIYPHALSDRMLQACSQAFDVSVFEIFFSWGNGMCLCSATNDTLFEDIESSVRALGVTHLSMTVTVASLLDPTRLPNVKMLVTSGEPMTDVVLETWAQQLWQGYGPSETTNICTVRKVSRGDSSPYLGWPLENTSAFVFSQETTDLMPLGCVGELCFGGDQVAAGYLNMPELTAAKFFNHGEYGRLYRSGDLGRMLPDGSLIILGRIDSQVKLRGLRIELQEIQTIVLRSKLAKACAGVLATFGSASTEQLALFYVPNNYERPGFSVLAVTDPIRKSISMIQQTLRDTLPDYMVPSFVIPITALPLTSSGKVDHDSLRSFTGNVSDETLNLCSIVQEVGNDSSEWTKDEVLIAEVISDALCIDIKAINRWGSFATLGIDSISAIPIARKLQAALRKRIPLSTILSNPSVGRLASALTKDVHSIAADPERKPINLPRSLVEDVQMDFEARREICVEKVLPCTPLQESMLSASRSSSVESYFNQMLFRLHFPSQTLKEYWNIMFKRHGILRTCFVTTEDARHPMVQVVLRSYLPSWDIFDGNSTNFQDLVSKHRSSLSGALDSGKPPVSLSLIRLDGSIEYLSFVCHHAIYDGVSMKQLLTEIEAVSRNEQLSAAPSFESFLQETLPLHPEADGFWEEHLRLLSPVRFSQLISVKDTNSYVVSGCASRHSYSYVAARTQELGVSLLPLCQAAWAITLSMLQGIQDVCFGNVVSGRSIALDQIDTLVAPCFNTIPIRMNLSNYKFSHQIINRFQRLNVEMMPYQFTSLRRIQSRLQLPYLFDTVLIIQPHNYALDSTIWSLELEHGAMDVPLVCEITPCRDQNVLLTQLHTHSSLFPHHISSLILDIFRDVIDACLDHPSSYMLTSSNLPIEWQRHISSLSLSRESARVDAGSQEYRNNGTWSKNELVVRSVLSRLLDIPEERVGLHISIYRYGLDSIGAIQLATLLRRESYFISAADVVENPTCAGIASRLTTSACEKARFVYDFDGFRDTASKCLDKCPRSIQDYEALLPCTPTQQGMISQFLNSDGAHYFNYTTLALGAGLNSQQVVEAWANVTTHCQILRTGFVPVDHNDTSYAMIIYPMRSFSAPVSIQRHSSFNDSEWRTKAVSRALKDLSTPPWQVVVVEHDSDQLAMHLSMHHALYDASSLRHLLHRLMEVLLGVMGEASLLIQPALSTCLDPAHSSSTSEAFWRMKAAGFTISKFPMMTPLHIPDRTFLNVSMACNMSSDSLRRSSSRANVTVRAALQAAWARVLSSYLGEESIAFGVVLDGRTTEEEREVIFPMVTTLPVFARCSSSNTELLDNMMKYNKDLRRYERTPLSRIQRWLGQPGSRLFDTIIAYQTRDSIRNELPWEILEETASVEYTVALEVVETTSGALQLNLTYQADTLPTEQARLLLQQFDALVIDLLTSPRGYSNTLSETKTSLFSIIPAACDEIPPPADLLHQLVERSAARIPTSIALEFVTELGSPVHARYWTYRELDEMGNRVANMLLHHNTPPGSIVAACFNKCPEAYFSILGILKAGCTFLSLDPGAPVSRLDFILQDSAASCLLIEPCLGNSLDLGTTVPTYNIFEHELFLFPASPLEASKISPSDACYCLYTSGTTGTPKGCLISHGNTVQAMLAFEHLFSGHWDEHSRWLQFASFHFDVSVLEQYWSWFVGITVVSAPKDLMLTDITTTISTLDITHIDLTPSLAKLIHPNEVPSLCKGIFITGGEQLRQEILQAWGPKKVIYNAYGPTEATIGVTMFQRVPVNGKSSNIGKQFPNVGAYVLEPGSEVPVLKGGVGELCVYGGLVGLGYLNRKSLTEERFPVLQRYGKRVYRTGDLVRVLHDNSFEFLGRADDQVKLRGQRLEIGEINHAIKSSLTSQITDVVTLVTRYLGQDRDLLVSFLTSNTGPPNLTDFRITFDQNSLDLSRVALEACKDRLPGYMVPTYIFCVPFIPLSANNKADTKRLKQLFAELPYDHLRNGTTGSTGAQRPMNEKEQLIASVISNIAQIEDKEIYPYSSIFELGIDSINAARLATALRSRGFDIATPSLILRHPQLSHLSQALVAAASSTLKRQVLQSKQYIRAQYYRNIGTVCRTLNIDKSEVEYIAPCTALQEGMITRSKAPGVQSAYFNQFQIFLDTQVSISRLKSCWDSVFIEYPVLRTTFFPTAEGHIQVAIKKTHVPWFEVSPEKDIAVLMSKRRDHWVMSNQDIIRDPIQIDYLEQSGKRILFLRLFHAIYDGRSFELLLQRVKEKYFNKPPVYSPNFLEALAHGPLLKHTRSKPFWERMFKGSSFQPIPAIATQPGALDVYLSQEFTIDGLETKRLALGVTHQTVIISTWLVALCQHLGFVPTVGVVFSGRTLVFESIENVIGPVFNTLPFKVDLTNHTNWASFVQEVQEYNASMLEYVHTPLRDIQKWCSKGKPLFDILLTFDREDVNPIVGGSRSFWSSIHSIGAPDYPLALEVVLLRNQSLRVSVVARKDISTEASMKSLIENFGQALAAFATSNGDVPLPNAATTSSGPGGLPHNSWLIDSSIPKEINGSGFFDDIKAQEVRHEIASLAGLPDEDVQENTRFLELGLDSIDGIKLATRLKKIGVRITISELMKNPTLSNIFNSHTITYTGNDKDRNEAVALKKSSDFLRGCLMQDLCDLRNVTAVLPPTPLQDSMVADMLLSRFKRYFNHDVLEISRNTDIDRLKRAWTTVCANSPILRTAFMGIDSPGSKAAFCQIIRDEPLEFGPMVELPSLDAISTVLDRARDKAISTNGTSNLFQLVLASTPDNVYLVISIAHALYDGWSIQLLHKDVQAAYDGHYHPRNSYEPYLAHMLFNYSAAGECFWADYLADTRQTILSPVANLQSSSHRPTVHRSELISTLGPRNIKALCRRYHITPQVLAQGCWAPVLASMSRSLDVVFGVVLSGRDTEETRDLLFPTMNTVPLRVVLHGTIIEYFNYLQANMSDIMKFQHFPLREVQKLSESKDRNLFNTLFLLQNIGDETAGPDSTILRSVHTSSVVDYPICVEMEITRQSIVWRIAGDEHYISLKDANLILAKIENVLKYFAEDYIDILEFDTSDEVSICGLEPFEISKDVDDETKPTANNGASQNMDSTRLASPVLEVLSKLSGIEKHMINPNHSIYYLGLDSISAIKASSMIRKYGLDVSVRDLLKAKSIGEIIDQEASNNYQSEDNPLYSRSLLESILNQTDIDSLLTTAGFSQADVEAVLPALPMQVHMISTWQNTDGLLFFPRFTFQLHGNTNHETVSKAWSTLVSETLALRTHFMATRFTDVPFVQIILKPKPYDSKHSQLNVRRNRQVYEESVTPFLYVRVENLDARNPLVHLQIHHALYDAISLPVLMNRFLDLCANIPTPSLGAHQPRWYEFVLNHYSPTVQQRRKEFWVEYLREMTPTCISTPHDPLRKNHNAGRASCLRHDAINDISKAKKTSSAHGVTLQALFFAAYSKVLAAMQLFDKLEERDRNVVFGVYLANRTSFAGVEEAPFPTLSIVPLLVKRPLTRSTVALAIDIQKDIIEIGSFENASVSLWEIYAWTGIQIQSSVNFLATPVNQNTAYETSSITMTEISDSPASNPNTDGPSWSPPLPSTRFTSRNEAMRAYTHTLDVEVAIRGGVMDIGIFNPPFLSESQSQDLIEDIITVLEASC
ncbi:acetyl-CoA synthetase-like protein [Daldinia sp. FL1419]|nr:acetyl-CoA synthetase-like protein [Daldinia sp. FL1419]